MKILRFICKLLIELITPVFILTVMFFVILGGMCGGMLLFTGWFNHWFLNVMGIIGIILWIPFFLFVIYLLALEFIGGIKELWKQS